MMSGQVDPSVLQRMVGAGAAAPTEVPVTASRAMRLAAPRAAERTVGLRLTVIGVGEEALALEGVQDSLQDELLLLKLQDDNGLVGVVALDRGLIAAIVEVQTTGSVGAIAPETRAVTAADIMFAEPFIEGVFSQLHETTQHTVLEGWADGVGLGDRFENVRAIGLALEDLTYRVMRLTLDLGGGDRQGEIILALPAGDVAQPVQTDQPQKVNWSEELYETVMEAPATLTAVLHRFDLPLYIANGLEEGQVLAIPGCTVSSVQLVGPDGARVARAKLGQVSGHIAVRLEEPLRAEMTSLDAPASREVVPENLVLPAVAS